MKRHYFREEQNAGKLPYNYFPLPSVPLPRPQKRYRYPAIQVILRRAIAVLYYH